MNKKNGILLFSAFAMLASCSIKKNESTMPDIKVNTKYLEVLNSLKSGGQPGDINLNGIVVNSDNTLNNKISVEQTVGKSEVETKQSESSLPKLNAELKRKDDYLPTKFSTYLNIGCDLKDDSRIEDMKELKNKPNELGLKDIFGAASSMVDKIFVCGKVDVFEIFVFLNANEIYFLDVELKKEQQFGSVVIITDSLILEGKNIIRTSGLSNSMATSAPDIKLTVYEKLSGTGNLKLISVGGDWINSQKK